MQRLYERLNNPEHLPLTPGPAYSTVGLKSFKKTQICNPR